MKMNFLNLFAVAAIAFSANTFAAPTTITGAEITGGDTGACKVLGENVRINLSKGVNGAYDCFEATNSINVGACHTSGSRSTQLTCAQIGFEADGTTAKYNNAACNDSNVGDTITISTPSYRGFRASTTGGSVAAQSLSSNCTADTAKELVAQ